MFCMELHATCETCNCRRKEAETSIHAANFYVVACIHASLFELHCSEWNTSRGRWTTLSVAKEQG